MKIPSTRSFVTVRTFSAFPVTSAPRTFSRMKRTPTISVTSKIAPCCPTSPNASWVRSGRYSRKNSQK